MTETALQTLQRKLCPWLRPPLSRLESAYAAERLGHAWLIAGARGVGKLNLALVFARRLLERRRPTEEPPDLAAAEAVAALRDRHLPADHHPDLHWLFPEEDKTAVSVEQVREAAAVLNLKAHAGGAKVVLLERADGMTTAAALVGEGRVSESVADDPLPRRQRGPDHGVEMLRARREHQQGLDLGRQRAVVAVEDPTADRLAERSAAGLARREHVDAA